MSDEKRDTPTSSLTQAGDIVDTFWDIKPIEFPPSGWRRGNFDPAAAGWQ